MEKAIAYQIKTVVFFLLFFVSFFVNSQQKIACTCEDIRTDNNGNGFISNSKIDLWVNRIFLKMFQDLALQKKIKQFPHNEVSVIKVPCLSNGAVAKRCEKQKEYFNNNPFLILYDEEFLKQIDIKDDKGQSKPLNVLFVLGHELGHLLSDHYHNTIPIDENLEKYIKRMAKQFNRQNDANDSKKMTIAEKYLEEFTADAYAVWFLRQYYENNKLDPSIAKVFHPNEINLVMRKINTLKPDICFASLNHPSCENRGSFIEKLNSNNNWNIVFNNNKEFRGFASNYVDSTIAKTSVEQSAEYGLYIQREKKRQTADSLKKIGLSYSKIEMFEDAFQSLSKAKAIFQDFIFPNETAEIDTLINEIKSIINVKSFSKFSIISAGNYTNYSLKSDNNLINTTNSIIGSAGLRIGRYNFIAPFGFELDATYDLRPQEFDTFHQAKMAIERFSFQSINILPKLSFRIKTTKMQNKTKGMNIAAGPNWMKPINFNYQNFIVENNVVLKQSPSIGAVLSIGYETIKRKPKNNLGGLLRVSLDFKNQPLVYQTNQLINVNKKASAFSIGLSGSYGILPNHFIVMKK